jgi:hypothetical protein
MRLTTLLVDAVFMLATPVAVGAGVTAGLGICAGITLLHIKRAVIGSKKQGRGPEKYRSTGAKEGAQQIQLIAEVQAHRTKPMAVKPLRRSPFETVMETNLPPMARFGSL